MLLNLVAGTVPLMLLSHMTAKQAFSSRSVFSLLKTEEMALVLDTGCTAAGSGLAAATLS